jgi:hypothetical protein
MGGAVDAARPKAPGEKNSGAKRITGLHPSAPVQPSVLKEITDGGLDLQ